MTSDTDYGAELWATGSTTTSLPITVNNIVATTEPDWAAGFTLAPNPASGEVQLLLPGNNTGLPLVRLLDGLGRPAEGATTRRTDANAIVLDVSQVAAGMYWVQLTGDDGRAVRKLVVVH